MKKIITIFTLFLTIISSQNTIPSALLDFSDKSNDNINRKVERFYGLNPYNLGGIVYTKSTSYATNESLQRDIDIHWGTNFFSWSVGINVKQYWYNSKYNAVSYFSSVSSNLGLVIGMGGDNGGKGLDFHSIASGIDFNVVRFNNFDIRFTLGLQTLGSFTLMKGWAIPVINFSVVSGI